jgi:hypothetical protein
MSLEILTKDGEFKKLKPNIFKKSSIHNSKTINPVEMMDFNLALSVPIMLDEKKFLSALLNLTDNLNERYTYQLKVAEDKIFDETFDMLNTPLDTSYHKYDRCITKKPLHWGLYHRKSNGHISNDPIQRLLVMHSHDFWVPVYGTENFEVIEYENFNRTLAAYFPGENLDFILLMKMDHKVTFGKTEDKVEKYVFGLKNGAAVKNRCKEAHEKIIYPFIHFVESERFLPERVLGELHETDIASFIECYRCQSAYSEVAEIRKNVIHDWLDKNCDEYKETLLKSLNNHDRHTPIDKVIEKCF